MFEVECSKLVGRLLLKSIPKCGKMRVKLLKFSADEARLERLFPDNEVKVGRGLD